MDFPKSETFSVCLLPQRIITFMCAVGGFGVTDACDGLGGERLTTLPP